MRFFDSSAPVAVTSHRRLPHWSQPGVPCFITWRCIDSLPAAVLKSWQRDRNRWLRQRDIDPIDDPHWHTKLQSLPPDDIQTFHAIFTTRWHDHLDAGHGACLLAQPSLSKIVADSLSYFDGDRYTMETFVIMPNHVHLLVTFPTTDAILRQCESWKRFTARQINQAINRTGNLWQRDAFDHLVRNEDQFNRIKQYIAENPIKARLQPDQYRQMQK